MTTLFVDPEVSRRKFQQEIDLFKERQSEYHERGWWLIDADFPEVFIIFATPHITPPVIAFGAVLNFANYDLHPPSVHLVHPFTRQPFLTKDLPTRLPRKHQVQLDVEGQEAPLMAHQIQNLMISHDENAVPFLCLAGVREYHQHPAHTDDPWLQHRHGPRGTLHAILEILFRYGVSKIQLGAKIQYQLGYNQNDIPE